VLPSHQAGGFGGERGVQISRNREKDGSDVLRLMEFCERAMHFAQVDTISCGSRQSEFHNIADLSLGLLNHGTSGHNLFRPKAGSV
jgi:hypothetical protein